LLAVEYMIGFIVLILRAIKPLKSYKENGLLRTFIFGFALYVGMLYVFFAAFIFGILAEYSVK